MILMLNNFKIIRLSVFIISVLLIGILTTLDDSGKKRIIDETIKGMNLSENKSNPGNTINDKVYIFSKQHTEHYLSAFKIFNDNKFFGVGVKNFRNFCGDEKYFVSDDACSTHPHNIYLQLLSETGLFGFLIFFSLFLYLSFQCVLHLYLSFRKKKVVFNDLEVCLISGILISLWPLAPTGNFFNNWLNIIFYFPVGIFLWSRSKTAN